MVRCPAARRPSTGRSVIRSWPACCKAPTGTSSTCRSPDRAGAMRKIDKADVYGAIVIPRDFTSASLLLAQSAATDTKAVRPVIEVVTNPRARTLCASIAFSYATRALAQANSGLGAQLNDTVTQQAQAKGLTLTGAAQTTPAAPIDV